MLTYVRVGLAALVAAAILAVPATPASAACPTRGNDYPVLTGILQLNAAPASGVQLTASGVGFRPGTIVCVEVASTPEQLATAKVTKDGGFTTTVTVPNLPLGQHMLRATGVVVRRRPDRILVGQVVGDVDDGHAIESVQGNAFRMVMMGHRFDDGTRQSPNSQEVRADLRVRDAHQLLLDCKQRPLFLCGALQSASEVLRRSRGEYQLANVVQ